MKDLIKNILKQNAKKTTPDEEVQNGADINNENIKSILQQLIQKPVSNDTFQKIITQTDTKNLHISDKQTKSDDLFMRISDFKTLNNLSNFEKQTVEFTKKAVESAFKLNQSVLNEKEIQTFKEIATLKELVEFANKKELNISKIVLSQTKADTKALNPPKNKIVLSSQKINNTAHKKFKTDINPDVLNTNDIKSNTKNKLNIRKRRF